MERGLEGADAGGEFAVVVAGVEVTSIEGVGEAEFEFLDIGRVGTPPRLAMGSLRGTTRTPWWSAGRKSLLKIRVPA